MPDRLPNLLPPEDQPTLPPRSEGEVALLLSSTACPGRCFGKYELVAELGRGGMGVVFKAHQTDLHRPVAIKMILRGTVAGPEDLLRFRTEAEATAALHHPNIVRI